MTDVSKFCKKTIELLELERAAEVESVLSSLKTESSKSLEKKGVRIRNLMVLSIEVSLSGRPLIELGMRTANMELPTHKFGPGDTVRLSRPDEDPVDGVVYRVRKTSLVVALGKEDDRSALSTGPYQVDLVCDETTFKRLVSAMERLPENSPTPFPVREVLFGWRKPSFDRRQGAFEAYDKNLNQSQREAISFCLQACDVAAIHGPPGTGKTTTVAELIRQFLLQGLRVMAVAPSNVAVDNLMEKLSSFHPQKYRPVRLGHPARLLASVLDFSMENVVERTDNAALCRDIRKELTQLLKKEVSNREARRAVQGEMRDLRKELRQRERKAVKEVLTGSSLVMSTLTGCWDLLKHDDVDFDVVVIDEAGQGLEAACWIPLLKAKKRVIIAGDHMQLPPTITSEKAARLGLQTTLLDRVVKMFQGEESVTKMLDVQYRMHETIMNFSSKELYQGRLKAHESVAKHLLLDVLDKSRFDAEDEECLARYPLVYIDTAGCGMIETQEEEGSSRENAGEARCVAEHVEALLGLGVNATDIAVISPYNAQVARIRSLFAEKHPQIEVGSVDGFQGREKEAVIISLVRSNKKGEVGFLSDFRRMNVAITRARRHCCIIGNSQTISSDSFLKRMVQYLEEHADVRTAQKPGSMNEVLISTKQAVDNVQKQVVVVEVKKEPTPPPSPSYLCSMNIETTQVVVSRAIMDLEHQRTETVRQKASARQQQQQQQQQQQKTDEEKKDSKQQKKKNLSTNQKKKKAPNNNNKNNNNNNNNTNSDNDDSLLDSIIASKKEGLCHFKDCKSQTSLVMAYTTCRHCAFSFCTSHALPEIHGCGDAAKKQARKEWVEKSKQAQQAKAEPAVVKKPADPELLQLMLKKKLDKEKEKRNKKAPPKKK